MKVLLRERYEQSGCRLCKQVSLLLSDLLIIGNTLVLWKKGNGASQRIAICNQVECYMKRVETFYDFATKRFICMRFSLHKS